MRQNTRRILCRLGFALLCVLPTLGVLSVVAGRFTSRDSVSERSHWQSVLSQRLGLNVELASVSHPETNRTVLQKVQLADPETGKEVASAGRVEVLQTPQGLMLLLSRVELQTPHLSRLWETLQLRLLRDDVSSPLHVEAKADELILAAANKTNGSTVEPQRLANVRFTLKTSTESGEAELEFRINGGTASEPARFRALRDRQRQTTRWELNTGGETLPCAMLVDYVTGLAALGDNCRFHGAIWAERSTEGWQGDVTGRFHDVDMNRLVTERFPHTLDTTAEMVLQRGQFRQGRLVDAAGSLQSEAGTISRSLLLAAAEQLKLAPHGSTEEQQVPFQRLALGFMIDSDGLTLSGHCDRQGTILMGNQEALLSESSTQRIEMASLVRALVPHSETQVPATQETDALLRMLPVFPTARNDKRNASKPPAIPR